MEIVLTSYNIKERKSHLFSLTLKVEAMGVFIAQ
jgi:hypothetical protein